MYKCYNKIKLGMIMVIYEGIAKREAQVKIRNRHKWKNEVITSFRTQEKR